MSSYWVESCIWGFHIYEEVWTPFIGERLGCAGERSNREDPFAIAMKRGTKRLAMYRARSRASLRSSCSSVGPYLVKLQGAADRASTYSHFSYTWHHRLAVAVYVSIYSDVQIFVDEIFADGCWSAKTTKSNPAKTKAHMVAGTYTI